MKLKTHKATAKKIKVSGGKKKKKYVTKQVGQDHFNARESGKQKRNKRRAASISPTDEKNVRRLLPYS
ncbi:MAG: 50S ribosomal protein L35 [Candidatus Buchananbacteria bacterium]|nr:50S ribosomal protein L35 [Candidatus Buchananbacteria bacterium]